MVRGGGLEPHQENNTKLHDVGHNKPTTGQDRSKVGQHQGVTDSLSVNKGTVRGLSPTPLRTPTDHNIPITTHNIPITESDLKTVIEAWPDLADEVKAGIVEMVKAAKEGKEGDDDVE